MQLKSMLLDFFNSEAVDSLCLPGIEHVISVSLGPTPPSLNTATAAAIPNQQPDSTNKTEELPKIHIRTYMIKMLASGTRIPRVELSPMGPFLDLSLRRYREPDHGMLQKAMKRPKLKKQDVEQGLGKKKRNMEVDEMGDLRGHIHVGKQDLSRLQTRKMKGLKPGLDKVAGDEGEEEEGEEEEEKGPRRKKNRTQ